MKNLFYFSPSSSSSSLPFNFIFTILTNTKIQLWETFQLCWFLVFALITWRDLQFNTDEQFAILTHISSRFSFASLDSMLWTWWTLNNFERKLKHHDDLLEEHESVNHLYSTADFHVLISFLCCRCAFTPLFSRFLFSSKHSSHIYLCIYLYQMFAYRKLRFQLKETQ